MATLTTTHPTVPLAVWPVAQTTAQWQRAGRYLPACSQHPGKMLPELARRIVVEYSAPGELVVDPLAGIGTTVAEAALLGRQGRRRRARGPLGCSSPRRTWTTCWRRASAARPRSARATPASSTELLGDLAGRVDLVVTSPPYGCDAGVIDKPAWLAGRRLCPSESLNYSKDRANLGHARGDAYAEAMAEIYAACHAVLRPGGRLVVVTKNTRRRGRTARPGRPHRLARHARRGSLTSATSSPSTPPSATATSPPARRTGRSPRSATPGDRGEPAHLVAHEDVTVFVKTRRSPVPR